MFIFALKLISYIGRYKTAVICVGISPLRNEISPNIYSNHQYSIKKEIQSSDLVLQRLVYKKSLLN